MLHMPMRQLPEPHQARASDIAINMAALHYARKGEGKRRVKPLINAAILYDALLSTQADEFLKAIIKVRRDDALYTAFSNRHRSAWRYMLPAAYENFASKEVLGSEKRRELLLLSSIAAGEIAEKLEQVKNPLLKPFARAIGSVYREYEMHSNVAEPQKQ